MTTGPEEQSHQGKHDQGERPGGQHPEDDTPPHALH